MSFNPGVTKQSDELAVLRAENTRLRKALGESIQGMDNLIEESQGVYGLHLNDDPAPWSELLHDGPYGEWLQWLEDARAALAAEGEGEDEAR